jgi:hypothetical protein
MCQTTSAKNRLKLFPKQAINLKLFKIYTRFLKRIFQGKQYFTLLQSIWMRKRYLLSSNVKIYLFQNSVWWKLWKRYRNLPYLLIILGLNPNIQELLSSTIDIFAYLWFIKNFSRSNIFISTIQIRLVANRDKYLHPIRQINE